MMMCHQNDRREIGALYPEDSDPAATYRRIGAELEGERAAVLAWLDGPGRNYTTDDRAWAQAMADGIAAKVVRAQQMADAAEWIAQADKAGMSPTAVVGSDGAVGLFCWEGDVERACPPVLMGEKLSRVIRMLRTAGREVHSPMPSTSREIA